MVERPIQSALEEVGEQAHRRAATLCPWLPDPHACDCGAWCASDVQWVSTQAMAMPVWQCEECDRRYYRTRD